MSTYVNLSVSNEYVMSLLEVVESIITLNNFSTFSRTIYNSSE